jgi:hypothetical protein
MPWKCLDLTDGCWVPAAFYRRLSLPPNLSSRSQPPGSMAESIQALQLRDGPLSRLSRLLHKDAEAGDLRSGQGASGIAEKAW